MRAHLTSTYDPRDRERFTSTAGRPYPSLEHRVYISSRSPSPSPSVQPYPSAYGSVYLQQHDVLSERLAPTRQAFNHSAGPHQPAIQAATSYSRKNLNPDPASNHHHHAQQRPRHHSQPQQHTAQQHQHEGHPPLLWHAHLPQHDLAGLPAPRAHAWDAPPSTGHRAPISTPAALGPGEGSTHSGRCSSQPAEGSGPWPLLDHNSVARAPPPRSAAAKGVSRALTVHRSGFKDPRTSHEPARAPPLAAEQSCPEIGHMTAPVFLVEPCKDWEHLSAGRKMHNKSSRASRRAARQAMLQEDAPAIAAPSKGPAQAQPSPADPNPRLTRQDGVASPLMMLEGPRECATRRGVRPATACPSPRSWQTPPVSRQQERAVPAQRSTGVQAAPLPWSRFFFPDRAKGASHNPFYEFMDVCVPAKMDPDEMPSEVVLEGVPEATAERWLKLYYVNDLHNQPGKHKKDEHWPKATTVHGGYQSHEILNSSSTYWKPGDGAQRMVLEEFAEFVCKLKPRSSQDTKPLMELQCGLIMFMAAQMKQSAVKAAEMYHAKETLLQQELSCQVEDARRQMQAEMDALLKQHRVEVASKDHLSSVVGKFRNAAFSKVTKEQRELLKTSLKTQLELETSLAEKQQQIDELAHNLQSANRRINHLIGEAETLAAESAGAVKELSEQNQMLKSEMEALKTARDQDEGLSTERLTDLQTRAKLGDKAEEYFEQWQTAQQEVDRMKAAVAKRAKEMRRTQDEEMHKAASLLQQAQAAMGGEAQQLVQEVMAGAEKMLHVEREKSLNLTAEKQQEQDKLEHARERMSQLADEVAELQSMLADQQRTMQEERRKSALQLADLRKRTTQQIREAIEKTLKALPKGGDAYEASVNEDLIKQLTALKQDQASTEEALMSRVEEVEAIKKDATTTEMRLALEAKQRALNHELEMAKLKQCSDLEMEALQARLNQEQQSLHELLTSVDKLEAQIKSSSIADENLLSSERRLQEELNKKMMEISAYEQEMMPTISEASPGSSGFDVSTLTAQATSMTLASVEKAGLALHTAFSNRVEDLTTAWEQHPETLPDTISKVSFEVQLARLKKTVSDRNGDLKICKAKLHMLDTQLKINLKVMATAENRLLETLETSDVDELRARVKEAISSISGAMGRTSFDLYGKKRAFARTARAALRYIQLHARARNLKRDDAGGGATQPLSMLLSSRLADVSRPVADASEIVSLLDPEEAACLMSVMAPSTASEMLWMCCLNPDQIPRVVKTMYAKSPAHTAAVLSAMEEGRGAQVMHLLDSDTVAAIQAEQCMASQARVFSHLSIKERAAMLGTLHPPASLGLLACMPDHLQRRLTLAKLPPEQRARLHQQVPKVLTDAKLAEYLLVLPEEDRSIVFGEIETTLARAQLLVHLPVSTAAALLHTIPLASRAALLRKMDAAHAAKLVNACQDLDTDEGDNLGSLLEDFLPKMEASGECADMLSAALQAHKDRAWAQELVEQTRARVAAAQKSELAHKEQLAAAQAALEEHLLAAEAALQAAEEKVDVAATSGEEEVVEAARQRRDDLKADSSNKTSRLQELAKQCQLATHRCRATLSEEQHALKMAQETFAAAAERVQETSTLARAASGQLDAFVGNVRDANHPELFERIMSSLEGMDEQTRDTSTDRELDFIVNELSKLSDMHEPLHQLKMLQSTLAVWQQALRLAMLSLQELAEKIQNEAGAEREQSHEVLRAAVEGVDVPVSRVFNVQHAALLAMRECVSKLLRALHERCLRPAESSGLQRDHRRSVVNPGAALQGRTSFLEGLMCPLVVSLMKSRTDMEDIVRVAFQYLRDTYGMSCMLSEVTYDVDYDADGVDDPDTYDDNVFLIVVRCGAFEDQPQYHKEEGKYLDRGDEVLEYMSANSSQRITEGPCTAIPIIIPKEFELKSFGNVWGEITVHSKSEAVMAAAEDELCFLSRTMVNCVMRYLRAEEEVTQKEQGLLRDLLKRTLNAHEIAPRSVSIEADKHNASESLLEFVKHRQRIERMLESRQCFNMMLELKRYRSVTHVVVGVTSCVVMLLDHQNQTLRDLLSQGMPSNPNSLRFLWDFVRNCISAKSTDSMGSKKRHTTIVERMRTYVPTLDPTVESYLANTMGMFTRSQIKKSSRVLDLLADWLFCIQHMFKLMHKNGAQIAAAALPPSFPSSRVASGSSDIPISRRSSGVGG